MKVLIAPQAFKGTLSATQVCKGIGAGILQVAPNAQLDYFPLSDGGDGFLEALSMQSSFKLFDIPSKDSHPLQVRLIPNQAIF